MDFGRTTVVSETINETEDLLFFLKGSLIWEAEAVSDEEEVVVALTDLPGLCTVSRGQVLSLWLGRSFKRRAYAVEFSYLSLPLLKYLAAENWHLSLR